MDARTNPLLKSLYDCATACNHCFQACFQEDDVKRMARCIQLDRACAELCLLTASYVGSSSPVRNILLEACARVCAACAEECSKHNEEHCQQCAEACRKCDEACRGAL